MFDRMKFNNLIISWFFKQKVKMGKLTNIIVSVTTFMTAEVQTPNKINVINNKQCSRGFIFSRAYSFLVKLLSCRKAYMIIHYILDVSFIAKFHLCKVLIQMSPKTHASRKYGIKGIFQANTIPHQDLNLFFRFTLLYTMCTYWYKRGIITMQRYFPCVHLMFVRNVFWRTTI